MVEEEVEEEVVVVHHSLEEVEVELDLSFLDVVM